MPPRGSKSKPPDQAVTRHKPMHTWIEVDNVPHKGGPKLPAKRRDGTAWDAHAREIWTAWSSMPHCALWLKSDWQFALETVELASRAFEDGAKVSLLTELRYREKVLGTTWSARQDLRLRYVTPTVAQDNSAGVTVLDTYRSL